MPASQLSLVNSSLNCLFAMLILFSVQLTSADVIITLSGSPGSATVNYEVTGSLTVPTLPAGVTIEDSSQVGLLYPTPQSEARWFEFDRFTGYANSSEDSQLVLELSTPITVSIDGDSTLVSETYDRVTLNNKGRLLFRARHGDPGNRSVNYPELTGGEVVSYSREQVLSSGAPRMGFLTS